MFRRLVALLLLAASASASKKPQFVGPALVKNTPETLPPLPSVSPPINTEFSGGESLRKAPVHISKKAAIAAGLVLAFNSGYSNGCCLAGGIVEGNKQAVAAVTGAWTTSALGYAQGNMAQFKTQITMILSYMGGSAIAGALNPTPDAFKLSPSTGGALLLCGAAMFVGTSMASTTAGAKSALAIFCLAAIANGIQNSITSVHTGNLIRSSHYSGMTSDMGTFIGQLLRGNKANLFRLKVCSALAFSFFVGGFSSVYAVRELGTSSLLVSAVIYAATGLAVFASTL